MKIGVKKSCSIAFFMFFYIFSIFNTVNLLGGAFFDYEICDYDNLYEAMKWNRTGNIERLLENGHTLIYGIDR